MIGIKLVVCKCTAGRASPENTYGGGDLRWYIALAQLQRTGLVARVSPRFCWE